MDDETFELELLAIITLVPCDTQARQE